MENEEKRRIWNEHLRIQRSLVGHDCHGEKRRIWSEDLRIQKASSVTTVTVALEKEGRKER